MSKRSKWRFFAGLACRSASLVLCFFILLCTPYVNGSGGDEDRNIEKQAVKRVHPPYPPLAQRYRIEGVVTVQLTVDKEGKVQSAEFVRGHNIFRSVSLDAAKRWEFKPPAEETLQGTIRFTFKLQ
jgi:TonB family protein